MEVKVVVDIVPRESVKTHGVGEAVSVGMVLRAPPGACPHGRKGIEFHTALRGLLVQLLASGTKLWLFSPDSS